MLEFEVVATDGAARRGVVRTAHGEFETPGFLAVATRAAVKGLPGEAAERAGVQAMICNAFHLAMAPGAEVVAAAGGLHAFMGWDRPLATDSGGFQVFSLRHGHVADELKGRRRLHQAAAGEQALDAVRVDEEGADFRSFVDGTRHRFTPESNMRLQRDLGADILFCLDECTPFHVDAAYTRAATERNRRWAARCLQEFERLEMGRRQALYGIVHGGIHPELREWSARTIAELDFAGHGIGDCLGETKADWYRVVEQVCPLLPESRPRHLLGVGEPDDLVEGALRGVDQFDCAMPTRLARHGQALHHGRPRFRLDLGRGVRDGDDGPIEAGCDCHACARFSRAYVRHLVRAGEAQGIALLVEHNLRFVTRLLEQVREAISAGRLRELRDELLGRAA